MLSDDHASRRQDRDHFLLARGSLKACKAEFEDTREWIQQELIDLKFEAAIQEPLARTTSVQTQVRQLLDRVNEINLSIFNSCKANLDSAIEKVETRAYQDPFEAHTILEREMMQIRELAREIFTLRTKLLLLTEDLDDC